MPDYNIYIRAISGGVGNINPTVPWSMRDNGGGAGGATTSASSDSLGGAGANAASGIIKATSFMANPDSLIASAITAIGKAFPIAAAAYAVVKLGEAILDNAFDFAVLDSGDYRFQTQWQNFKTGTNIALHPISSSISAFKVEKQWQRENYKRQAQRDLLGDSVINSYTGRGV